MSESGNIPIDGARIAFHISVDFFREMLEPVYNLLKDKYSCLITRDLKAIIDFKPHILLIAEHKYFLYRHRLPGTIIIWVRHGFASKGIIKKAIVGADFACVSSEWIRDEYLRQGWQPRLDYWITGFTPMDSVLNPGAGKKKPAVPRDFARGRATLLYAPTWNRYLGSAEILGEKWIEKVRQRVPDINIIIKPHPMIPRLYPHIIKMWQQASQANKRVWLVADANSNVYDLFPRADILLSDASSVIFFYLALDRPIILVSNPLRFRDKGAYNPEGVEWKWRDVGIQIGHGDELPDAVLRVLNNPGEKAKERAIYRERVFGRYLDGRAAERTASKIQALINPAPEDKEWVLASWNKMATFPKLNLPTRSLYYLLSLANERVFFMERYPQLKHLIKRIFVFLK